jgi:ABC-type antimicrobial peptide transport system permease subunit
MDIDNIDNIEDENENIESNEGDKESFEINNILKNQKTIELDEESLEMIEHDLMVDENEDEEDNVNNNNNNDDDDNDNKEDIKDNQNNSDYELETESQTSKNISSSTTTSVTNSKSHSHQRVRDAIDEIIEESIKMEEFNEIIDSKRKFKTIAAGEKRTSPAKRNKKNSKKEENIPIINEEQYEAYLSYGRK